MCLTLQSCGEKGAVWPTFSPIRWVNPRRFVNVLVCYVFYLLLWQCSLPSSLYGEPETRSQCVCLFFIYHESCKTQIPWWCSTLILLASPVYPSIKYYDFLNVVNEKTVLLFLSQENCPWPNKSYFPLASILNPAASSSLRHKRLAFSPQTGTNFVVQFAVQSSLWVWAKVDFAEIITLLFIIFLSYPAFFMSLFPRVLPQ